MILFCDSCDVQLVYDRFYELQRLPQQHFGQKKGQGHKRLLFVERGTRWEGWDDGEISFWQEKSEGGPEEKKSHKKV